MEASSIITQVSRDDEHLNSYANEKVKNDGSGESTPSDTPEPAAVPVLPNAQPKKTSQGSKAGNFFRTLFCCIRGKKGKGPAGQGGEQCTDGALYAAGGNRCSYLLPPVRHQDMYKKCMVIDLDETLVHSSFKPITNADFVVPVEIDGTVHQVYVLKRPHVDEFLKRMGELYECVLFTASLAKYADPVADLLDQWGVFRARLFRESCVFYRGNYVKDLNKLGRELQQIVIVDNSPASYIFHPDNAVPVASWFDDMNDSELMDLIPFFEKLAKMDNVYTVLCNSNHPYNTTTGQQQQVNGPQNHVQANHSPAGK
ncbi:unnamed protein product [Acanthoscelides obtectus]|uniref:protein-serine/threonine phosphatase n=1 Tax=Acanthoscelides obtectus TaxID=200917 RepID=A0A9P0Q7W9_ACAOB|nr:unnamed protein product [Acanthoscelides obtectus]CAK1673557.1 Carboxy-terminal domain RNA polymerase II polypeptide A small phosphatase 1 [Acanthoscelides obtectus]